MSRLDKSAVLKETATLNVKHTPWNMNMEPKSPPLEKEKHLPNLHFWVQHIIGSNILHFPKTNIAPQKLAIPKGN